MRDSMIFYRSFYEAIKDLPLENQGEIYNAVFSYGLDFKEPNLNGISKVVWTLIKPQVDANIRKYNNGTKEKKKQNRSKVEAKHKLDESKVEANVNDNVNVNDNYNGNDKENDNNNDNNLSGINPQKNESLSLEGEEKKERKKLAPKKERNLSELQYPYLSESFINTWDVLINEPKWRKKTTSALQASLVQLSKYSEDVAIEMMLQSISGNYQGLFEIKKFNNGKSNSEIDSYNADLERRAKQLGDNIGF